MISGYTHRLKCPSGKSTSRRYLLRETRPLTDSTHAHAHTHTHSTERQKTTPTETHRERPTCSFLGALEQGLLPRVKLLFGCLLIEADLRRQI